jgi:PQQ-like domain
MRAAALSTRFLGLLAVAATASAQVPPPAVKAAKIAVKEETKKDEPFDQRKSDLETVKSAGYTDDVKSLTDFYRNHTVTEADRARITGLIRQLADDMFEAREAASEQLSKSGVPAIALLKAAMNARDADYEIARRCEIALKVIEKVPTRSLATAAARLLATHKDEGITEVLLNYLPLAEDESVSEEIRNTLTALAVRDGKPDRTLETALEDKDALKRGAAAESFARANNKDTRERMKAFLKKESDSDVKLLVALALVNEGRDKEVVPEVIRLMAEVPAERGWRAEELLWRIAGEDGPAVSLGNDKPSRDKARDEWAKWWTANEKKVDLAKLDQESSYGLTIVCESPMRGGQGRVVALGGDGKERWKVAGLNWPMDAVPLAGKKVLIAEHNRNRIVEKEIDGKEIWSEVINQPVNVGRLPNGVTWAVGRNQIIEWERGDKPGKKHVFDFLRNEYDIVAGARLKSGEYVVLTQNQQLLKVDRKGAITKSHNVGGNGVNYYSTVDVLPSGKVLVTLMNSITEFDLETGKQGWSANYQYATSAVRLRNGNTLVGHQNNGRIVELDKDGKPTKWQYTGTDTAYRPFRAFKR